MLDDGCVVLEPVKGRVSGDFQMCGRCVVDGDDEKIAGRVDGCVDKRHARFLTDGEEFTGVVVFDRGEHPLPIEVEAGFQELCRLDGEAAT